MLYAGAGSALIGLPLEDGSDAPVVGWRCVRVTCRSDRTQLDTDRHLRVELGGLYANVGGRRGKFALRLPHVGAFVHAIDAVKELERPR